MLDSRIMKKIFLASIILTLGIVVSASVVIPGIASAQNQATISINPNIPGVNNISTTGPCGWIVNFYDFALLIAGILAFGAIVYGGVKAATSVGNPHGISEGRAWIYSALLGLLLLGSAYLILYTINPNLTKCQLPTLSTAYTPSVLGGLFSSNPSAPPAPGAPSAVSGQCAGGACQPLPNCIPSSRVNCGAAAAMVNTIDCIDYQQNDPNFNVSEGYPPTGQHSSACHNNGCCIDTTVPGGNCAAVQQLMQAAQQCGATALNEYSGCSGTTYTHTTGGNVHINAPKGQGGC
jgi:hypothetical protein